jgi:hypothetical protein
LVRNLASQPTSGRARRRGFGPLVRCWFMRPFPWSLGLAAAIVSGSACGADVQLPWMSLVVDGTDLGEGVLVNYCWSSITVVCAGGNREEPPTYVVRSSQSVNVQVRTKAAPRELRASVTPADPRRSTSNPQTTAQTGDSLQSGTIPFGPSTRYISVFSRWDRGDASFLFALRVEPE